MTETRNSKRYDLEDRTLQFTQKVNAYVNKLPRTITNIENGKQLTRSAGSVGANYIEANEALSKKDFVMRIKICRKEAKETRYWLVLTQPLIPEIPNKEAFVQESTEFVKIFNAILEKSK